MKEIFSFNVVKFVKIDGEYEKNILPFLPLSSFMHPGLMLCGQLLQVVD